MALIFLIGVVGTWSVATRITSAVAAIGTIESTPQPQEIKLSGGGIVSRVLVHDGDRVKKGDVLVKTDVSSLETQLSKADETFFSLQARKARLVAERHGLQEIVFGQPTLKYGEENRSVAFAVQTQTQLFNARLELFLTRTRLLKQEKSQYENQIIGLTAQKSALLRQLELAQEDWSNARVLYEKGLSTALAVNQKEAKASELGASISAISAKIADIRAKQAAIKTKILSISSSRESDAGQELEGLILAETEIERKRAVLRAQIANSDLRSPIDGIVFRSKSLSIGAAIEPFEVLMLIVPTERNLVVSAKISTKDIEKVTVGQRAILKFPGISGRRTPEIVGNVYYVSEYSFAEKRNGTAFFVARINVPDSLAVQGNRRKLFPGMVAEVFLQGEARAPIELLTRPFGDYFSRVLIGG